MKISEKSFQNLEKYMQNRDKYVKNEKSKNHENASKLGKSFRLGCCTSGSWRWRVLQSAAALMQAKATLKVSVVREQSQFVYQ